MPAMRPASANRQAKRQSPTRSRTMRRYVRCRAAGRPRIAADARDLHRGRRIGRRAFCARPHHPALRARAGRGSIPGRRSLLGGHAGCCPSLVAFRTSDRPLRRSNATDLFARRRRGLAARGRRHHHGPPTVHLADRRRTWWRRPAGGAVLSGDRIGEERPARPRDGVAHLLDAGGFLHRGVLLNWLDIRTDLAVTTALLVFTIPGGLAASATRQSSRRGLALREPLRSLFTQAAFLPVVIGLVAASLGWGTVGAFLPIFGKEALRLPSAQVGLLLALQAVANGASRIPGGMLVDRARRRWPIVFVGVVVWSAAAVVLGHLTGFWAPAIVLVAATPFMATAFVAMGVVFADLSAV